MSIPERSRRRPGTVEEEDLRGQELPPITNTNDITQYRRTQAAKAHSSTDITCAAGGATTLVTFDTTHYDTSSYIRSASTHRLYVPIAGYYLVWANYQEEGGTGTNQRCWTIHYVTSAGVDSTVAHSLYQGLDHTEQQVSTIWYAAAGSYFYSAMQNTGLAFDLDAVSDYSPEVSIALLGVDQSQLAGSDSLLSFGG